LLSCRFLGAASADESRDDRGHAGRERRQAENDEAHVLDDHVRSFRQTVQSVRQTQFDDERIDEHVPRVAQVAHERHGPVQAATVVGRRRQHGDRHCRA